MKGNRVAGFAALILVATAAVMMYPDLARYVRMRNM
jgi:hypothetical protein